MFRVIYIFLSLQRRLFYLLLVIQILRFQLRNIKCLPFPCTEGIVEGAVTSIKSVQNKSFDIFNHSKMVLSAIIGCSNRSGRDKDVGLHQFPKKTKNQGKATIELCIKRRVKWRAAINRKFEKDAKWEGLHLCSKHFVGGKFQKSFKSYRIIYWHLMHVIVIQCYNLMEIYNLMLTLKKSTGP